MRNWISSSGYSGCVATIGIILLAVVNFFGPAAVLAQDATPQTVDEFLDQWNEPSRDYSSGPLWTWNDMLTEEQIRETLQDLASQNVRQAWVHPRPGLMTPYLSEDWFRLWNVALDEAERLDMNIWIYDENSYPSGFAGGFVPEAMPESRGQGLHFRETDDPGSIGADAVAAFQIMDDGTLRRVASPETEEGVLPVGRYLVGEIRLAPSSGWYGGTFYVDLLKPGVTEKFIEITMDAYKRELGDQFGDRVPGWFTDEPQLVPAGGWSWTDDLPDRFEERWGYSLIDNLGSLTRKTGDWQRVRHNYRQLLLELFIERWARPCYEYCEANDLEFTGHYWEHGWPDVGHGPDNMAMYAWHQRPSIDTLMNEYSEDMNAQFGNARAVKELASIANQMGCNRTLSEMYGAGGWDLTFDDMRRIGDWSYALGVNTLNEHLSYVTIRGARKRDHPQSFSYHEPWWEAYHVMADHFTRLSVALSSGKQVNRILLIEPTTTCWIYQHETELGQIGSDFQDMINRLERMQVEYDLGSEDIIRRHGSIGVFDGDAKFRVGECEYDLVVLPQHMENVNGSTLTLLAEYAAAGGKILQCGPAPTFLDGVVSDAPSEAFIANETWRETTVDDTCLAMQDRTFSDGLQIRASSTRSSDEHPGPLFHHRRRLEDGELVFITNTSDATVLIKIYSKFNACRKFLLESGEKNIVFALPAIGFGASCNNISTAYFIELLPHESELRLFYDKPHDSLLISPSELSNYSQATTPGNETHIFNSRRSVDVKLQSVERLDPNVLTIDYVDATIGEETRESTYFYAVNRWIWEQHGMEGNPWDSSVQFRDELITKTFPEGSGFSAMYHFTLAEEIDGPLKFVVERPDLYTIQCNGQPIEAIEGEYYIDRAFGVLDITELAQVGENTVTITASPMTIYHELEPAYLLGDFSLTPVDSGFTVTKPQPLGPSAEDETQIGWCDQGMPFYSGRVAYTYKFETTPIKRIRSLRIDDWNGSVVKVLVNGDEKGWAYAEEIEFEFPMGYGGRGYGGGGRRYATSLSTDATENEITIIVYGTLKNTLGPHHAGEMRGKAWPSAFREGPEIGPPPGESYDVIPYGIFDEELNVTLW